MSQCYLTAIMYTGFLIFFLAALVLAEDDTDIGIGGVVCLRLEKMAENPIALNGRSAAEVQETAKQAVALMHQKKLDLVIDRLVAEAGGSTQIISKLAGMKIPQTGAGKPTTLIGKATLSTKKLNIAVKQGTGKKLNRFVEKKLAATLDTKNVDPEVIKLVAQVTANELSKSGVAKLEAMSNNQPRLSNSNKVSQSMLPEEGVSSSKLFSNGHPSKKTLCLFSPPREYCVVQSKDVSRTEPDYEQNPPDADGVADEYHYEVENSPFGG